MARRSGATFTKRQKEMARLQKRQDKMARRIENRRQKSEAPEPVGGDPQIESIRPGPQPVPAWVEKDRGSGGD